MNCVRVTLSWMLMWSCMAKQQRKDLPLWIGSPIEGTNSLWGSATAQRLIADDVVILIRHLGWTTLTILHDGHSELLVDQIILDLGTFANNIRFLNYNVSDDMVNRDFLQSLYTSPYFNLNFLVICKWNTTLSIMSKVNSHDLRSNRTTDFRHTSRWLIASEQWRLDNDDVMPYVSDLEHVAIYLRQHSNCETSTRTEHISVLTLSNSVSPERFVKVSVTIKPCNFNGERLLKDIYPNTQYGYNGRTLIVSSLMYAPFAMRKETKEGYVHEGFLIDLMDVMSISLNFSIELVEPADGEWGLKKEDGHWTGLVGQLEKREVDMVVAPLTIHEDRAQVMDFLLPAFHTENVDILYKSKQMTEQDELVVVSGFKLTLLLTITASGLGVIIVVFVFEEFSPDSKKYSMRTDKIDPDNLRTRRRRMKSMFSNIKDWWSSYDHIEQLQLIVFRIFGSLFKQGGVWEASTSPGRLLLSSWWLLTLVLYAGYSAYLVSSMAVQIKTVPFTDLHGVVNSKEYKVGLMSTGVIRLIFEKSSPGEFQSAWQKIVAENKTDPGVLAGSEDEHLLKVKAGDYCWIVDVTTAQKARASDCSLETVGVRLNGQQLAIGVPKNSPLKPALEEALSVIADSGLLAHWWQRWQKSRAPDMCPSPPDVHPIVSTDLVGPAYLALIGVGSAGVALVIEIAVHRLVLHKKKPSPS